MMGCFYSEFDFRVTVHAARGPKKVTRADKGEIAAIKLKLFTCLSEFSSLNLSRMLLFVRASKVSFLQFRLTILRVAPR